jgi:hypothetical protein
MVVNIISGEEGVALTLTIVVVAEGFLSGVDTTIITIITITTTIIDINTISLRLRSLMFPSQSPLPPLRLRLKSNSLQNHKNIKISFALTGSLPIKLINIWKFRRLKDWNQSRKS